MPKKLVNNLEKEIFIVSSDLSRDYLEIGIDSIYEGDIINEIPIIKSLYSFYKIGASLINRHNIKKNLIFLRQFKENKVSKENLTYFKKKFENNPEHREKVLEMILLLNERFLDERKSMILACLFSSYLEKKISWDDFEYMSLILNNFHPTLYLHLHDLFGEDPKLNMNFLKKNFGRSMLAANGIGFFGEDGYEGPHQSIGKKLYKFGLEPILSKLIKVE